MHSTLDDLYLEHLWMVHPDEYTFAAEKRITMLPLKQVEKIVFR
jgi:hypothetical protein